MLLFIYSIFFFGMDYSQYTTTPRLYLAYLFIKCVLT